MKERDYFDDRYFEITTRLDTLRSEAADQRRATAARRRAVPTDATTLAPRESACGPEHKPFPSAAMSRARPK
jgi:hypothetical protein